MAHHAGVVGFGRTLSVLLAGCVAGREIFLRLLLYLLAIVDGSSIRIGLATGTKAERSAAQASSDCSRPINPVLLAYKIDHIKSLAESPTNNTGKWDVTAACMPLWSRQPKRTPLATTRKRLLCTTADAPCQFCASLVSQAKKSRTGSGKFVRGAIALPPARERAFLKYYLDPAAAPMG